MKETSENTSNNKNYIHTHFVPRTIEGILKLNKDQFNFGLNLIANAFKDKVTNFEEEITRLTLILEEKDKKINELETQISLYLSERQEILNSNQKLVNENQYLLDVVDNLNRDLKKLEQIRHTLLYSIGPETSGDTVSNIYDSNKVSIQTKLMNIANHSSENISNYLNLSRAAEGNEGKYYNPDIFNKKLSSFSKKSQKGKIHQTLKKSFCENLAREALSEMSENHKEKSSMDEYRYNSSRLEKSKIDNLIDKLNVSINKRMNTQNYNSMQHEKDNNYYKTRNNLSYEKSGSFISTKITELKKDRFNLSSELK